MHLQYETELYHHGIKGQKWGVRRYQNADGSYTAAGRKRYAKQLTREFNKASKKYSKVDYRAQEAKKHAQRAEKFASKTNKGVLKPLSKLGTAYANAARKNAAAYDKKGEQQLERVKAAYAAAEKSGFMARTYAVPTVVDVKYYGAVTTYITRSTLQAKFTDPTQPKNRAERREEKDRNRLKNAAYEMDQAKADWKAKDAKAEATVGTTKEKTKYGTMERWNDPEHQHVKDVLAAQERSFYADKRFAKEFDAYKKKHPNTDMDLSDWEKKRKKMYY
jgi:hypothetical protein